MKDTKECIMCFNDIDARAKKCPVCRSVQNNYSNLESNSKLMGVIAVLFISFLGYMAYEVFISLDLEQESLKEINILTTDISTKKEGETLYVACIGTIDNPTKYTFTNAKFEVNFISETGDLVDTFPVEDNKIFIAANKQSNFRVRGVAQKSQNNYKFCKVNIVDAWSK
jgi:hypothetical protein